MATPTAKTTKRRYGPGKLWAYTLGTPILTHAVTAAYAGAASAFTQGTSATNIPGTTSLLPLGITKGGMEFTTSFDTEKDESAEYYYAHAVVMTGQEAKLKCTLKTVNITNLRFALNAPASAWSATPSATVASILTPPAPGSEVRCQLLWESLANDFVIVGYQALQIGDVSIAGVKGAEGVNLDLEFNFEQPDASVAAVPYEVAVIGATWVDTVYSE